MPFKVLGFSFSLSHCSGVSQQTVRFHLSVLSVSLSLSLSVSECEYVCVDRCLSVAFLLHSTSLLRPIESYSDPQT